MVEMTKKNRKSKPLPAMRVEGKVGSVVARIRSAILSGQYAPGSRLKTYDEFEPLLGVSRATLRSAIGVLKEEGFIKSYERSHMYVSPEPPHLSRYGLALKSQDMSSRFEQALSQVAEQLTRSGKVEVVIFRGIYAGSEHPDWDKLRSDIRSHRLAGLIVRSDPSFLEGTGALEDRTLPKIAVRVAPHPGFHRVLLDNQTFTDQGVDWLISNGRRQIAAIGFGTSPALECFIRSCETRGISLRPEWCIGLGLDYPESARKVAQLLASLPADRRPDGLMILDDNFAEYACSGLLAAGLRIPDEISLVVHCNWPWPVPDVVPMMRVGFDTHEVLHIALDMINRARRNESVTDVVVAARTKENLSLSK